MGLVSSFLKPLKENIKYRLRWRYLWKNWFLGRHACLGYDVLKHFENLPLEVNFQKGRADLLVQYWRNNNLLPKSSQINVFMIRKDVLPLIRQLEFFDSLPKHPPKFIFMDSFSELTDQLFVNKDSGWKFTCGYSDIIHNEDFKTLFNAEALLPLEELEKYYVELFGIFEDLWGKVPIYFLHFPIALEGREIYRERYRAIIEAIDKIANAHQHIHSIKINELKVRPPKGSLGALTDFPYHYNEETYSEFSKLINLNQFSNKLN